MDTFCPLRLTYENTQSVIYIELEVAILNPTHEPAQIHPLITHPNPYILYYGLQTGQPTLTHLYMGFRGLKNGRAK